MRLYALPPAVCNISCPPNCKYVPPPLGTDLGKATILGTVWCSRGLGTRLSQQRTDLVSWARHSWGGGGGGGKNISVAWSLKTWENFTRNATITFWLDFNYLPFSLLMKVCYCKIVGALLIEQRSSYLLEGCGPLDSFFLLLRASIGSLEDLFRSGLAAFAMLVYTGILVVCVSHCLDPLVRV